MDGNNGIAGVILAGEHGFGFQLLGKIAQAIDFFLEIVGDCFAFARQFKVSVDIGRAAGQLRVFGKFRFQPAALAHELLRAGLVRPHAGIGDLGFYVG